MAVGDFTTFSYTGAVQTMQLLAGKRYKIECWGAQGGSLGGNLGGYGGFAMGEIAPSVDTDINIYVGEQPTGLAGGWNGGGNSYTGAGGGGASDIRIGGTALANRVIVAGAGGGASGLSGNLNAGVGGGLVGGDGQDYGGGKNGLGGTQSAGGANGGSLGQGGTVVNDYSNGGGGGGYYGGGGARGWYSGGGGGSSYIGGVENGITVTCNHTGHGHIKITEIPFRVSFIEPLTILYTRYPQIVHFPKGKYKLEVFGAGGITKSPYTGTPAKGGYAAGEITLSADTVMYAFAGGKATESIGGWNGGGNSYADGAGGGGATDLRMGGYELSNRIIVGGAAGGKSSVDAGHGGGLVGGSVPDGSYPGGKGGSQSEGGSTNGALGVGGSVIGSGACGGGGGYYGGGGGGMIMSGGGGSSYYGTLENAETISGVNEGDGYIVITPLDKPYSGFPQII